MKACHISDTHDVHQDLNLVVPNDIEILFFTGDLTYRGAEWELIKLLEQFKVLSARIPHIVGCLGNHELGAEGKEEEWKQKFKDVGVTLLDHESVEINGIKIFGSPHTPWFFDWAFSYHNPKMGTQQGDEQREGEEVWKDIPEDTQVLLTHGPPIFILDTCRDGSVGCGELRRRIEGIPSIKYHMFGHIHEGYGLTNVGGVTYSNGSIMNGKYKFVNKPNCFDLEF